MLYNIKNFFKKIIFYPSTAAVKLLRILAPRVFKKLSGSKYIRYFYMKIFNFKRTFSVQVLSSKNKNHLLERKPRIYIDVTQISEFDNETGIQRVVKEVTHALYKKTIDIEPVGVELIGKHLVVAQEWLYKEGLLNEPISHKREAISFKTGDILLMIDSTWTQYIQFLPVFNQARKVNVPIVTVVYDILPLFLPWAEERKKVFKNWLHLAIANSDALLCISKSVAKDVVSYVQKLRLEHDKLKVGYWHLGFNFKYKSLCNQNNVSFDNYLLMVGTIEPRKSHDLVLSVLEELWDQGVEVKLCIAGKEGWMVDALMKKIRTHPLLNKKLFFFENPSDENISQLYQRASGLVFLSKGEGFGLPLVEAAHYGIPILCSDLPVFQEIAQEHATYVQLDDYTNLINQFKNWLHLLKTDALPNSKNIKTLSWEESADQLLSVIRNNQWYWQ